jgi:uncharacterized protein (TIGR02145 family)
MVFTLVFISCKKKENKEAPVPFSTTGTLTDERDGKVYKTIIIGGQTWMAENLNYQGLPAGSDTCYDNQSGNCDTYGTLYTLAAAKLAAPEGWHLPTDDECKTLEKYMGMTQTEVDTEGTYRGTDQGTKLKDGGSSGFNLKLGGYYGGSGFDGINFSAEFWTSTSGSSIGTAYFRHLSSGVNGNKVFRDVQPEEFRLSVRCIKD